MPEGMRQDIINTLENEILVNQNGHIDVGITGGAMLFKVLRDEGRDDLIYSMTSKTTYPSWGLMKESGATTIWEMWEKDLPGHSLLHSSYLYPGAWYIDGVAGIKQDIEKPGYRKFIVRVPNLNEEQMSWAKADFDSPAGLIKSHWQRDGSSVQLDVTVPPNCSATVWFPNTEGMTVSESSGLAKQIGERDGYLLYEVEAGNYQFKN
jgi:alpha-L-rhamnosidase